jgi:transposase
VRIVWRKRRWVCPDGRARSGSFVEQDEAVAARRARLTTRACRWAIEQIRREHAQRQRDPPPARLRVADRVGGDQADPAGRRHRPARFEGVTILGVDEHIWHHVSTKPVEDGGRGPKELTGMVDLSRDEHGNVRARLLDLVPGRSGQVYTTWLTDRGEAFRQRCADRDVGPVPRVQERYR